MKTLVTGVGSYPTGDAIAVAVLEYWRTLAEDHLIDLVELPFRAEDGHRSRVQLTIGWSSSFAAVDLDSADGPELVDHAFVDDLALRSLARSRAVVSPDGHLSSPFDLDGLSFLDGY